MTKLLVIFTRKIIYLLWLQNFGYIYILVLLFQLMLQNNIVKVVSKYVLGSVTVYTTWRLFVYWLFKLAMRGLTVDKRTNQYGYRWASRIIVYTILKLDAHSVTQ